MPPPMMTEGERLLVVLLLLGGLPGKDGGSGVGIVGARPPGCTALLGYAEALDQELDARVVVIVVRNVVVFLGVLLSHVAATTNDGGRRRQRQRVEVDVVPGTVQATPADGVGTVIGIVAMTAPADHDLEGIAGLVAADGGRAAAPSREF